MDIKVHPTYFSTKQPEYYWDELILKCLIAHHMETKCLEFKNRILYTVHAGNSVITHINTFSCLFAEKQATFIIRWCRTCNRPFINIRRGVSFYGNIAERRANSQWQTGWRFMYTFAYSYGVTRRGMTQCISASLLVLDRWSRPNMTEPSLIFSKDSVNFIYLLYWQWWLIGNVKNVSVPVLTPAAPRRRFTVTFGCCSIRCKRFMRPDHRSHS